MVRRFRNGPARTGGESIEYRVSGTPGNPRLPPLADQGSVEQSLQVKSVDVEGLVEKFFKEGAENALENSRFSKACGGKTITLVFTSLTGRAETADLGAPGGTGSKPRDGQGRNLFTGLAKHGRAAREPTDASGKHLRTTGNRRPVPPVRLGSPEPKSSQLRPVRTAKCHSDAVIANQQCLCHWRIIEM